MKRLFSIILFVFVVFTSCQNKKYEKYNYYDNGNVKEKYLFKNESEFQNNLNYLGFSYYKNGNIKEKYELKNGFLQGTYLQFYENGSIMRSAQYNFGKKHGFERFFTEKNKLVTEYVYINDIQLNKMKLFPKNNKSYKFFYYVEPDSLIENGLLVYNNKNNLIPKESFYYEIIGSDTIDYNHEYNISCKVYAMGNNVSIDSVLIGSFNEKYEFLNHESIIYLEPKSDSFLTSIKLKRIGNNLIMGKIYISGILSSKEKYSRELIFYKDFYAY